MILALYILLALAVVGGVLYWLDKRQSLKKGSEPTPASAPGVQSGEEAQGQECCGLHITCEKDSLLAGVSKEIEYYDDEELDAYRGREPQDYSEAEIEQFRDVLLTLLPTDIAGWARSLQLRGIALPAPVREELLMIVAENRKS